MMPRTVRFCSVQILVHIKTYKCRHPTGSQGPPFVVVSRVEVEFVKEDFK